MAKSKSNYGDIVKMAEKYGVADNALFRAAAEQYAVQQRFIQAIRAELDEDELMTTKEYVKGRQNIYANPLVRELPKHADSANRTLSTMLDIITKLGKEKPQESKLEKLLREC